MLSSQATNVETISFKVSLKKILVLLIIPILGVVCLRSGLADYAKASALGQVRDVKVIICGGLICIFGIPAVGMQLLLLSRGLPKLILSNESICYLSTGKGTKTANWDSVGNFEIYYSNYNGRFGSGKIRTPLGVEATITGPNIDNLSKRTGTFKMVFTGQNVDLPTLCDQINRYRAHALNSPTAPSVSSSFAIAEEENAQYKSTRLRWIGWFISLDAIGIAGVAISRKLLQFPISYERIALPIVLVASLFLATKLATPPMRR